MNGVQRSSFGGWEPSFRHVILRMEFRSSGLVGDTFTCCGPPSRLAAPYPGSFLSFCCLNLYSTTSFLRHPSSFLSPCPSSVTRLPGTFHSTLRTPDVAFLQPPTHTPQPFRRRELRQATFTESSGPKAHETVPHRIPFYEVPQWQPLLPQ